MLKADSPLLQPRSSVSVLNPPPSSSSGANKSEEGVVVKEKRSLRGKRKVVEIKEAESSDSGSEIGTGNSSEYCPSR
jgi:hypothetical protein